MIKSYLAQYGLSLLNRGYAVVPIKAGLKHPGRNGWQDIEADEESINEWLANGYKHGGVGVKTEFTPAIDIDIRDPDVTKQVVEWCRENLGPTVERVGQAPKILLAYRCDEPFTKLSSRKYIDPFGQEQQIEILGTGQQFVAYGIHPDTKKPYEWISDVELNDSDLDQLPTIDRDQVVQLIEWFESIVPADWELKTTRKSEPTPNLVDDDFSNILDPSGKDFLQNAKPVLDLTDKQVNRALSYVDPEGCDYDQWLAVGMALYHQYEGDKKGLRYWESWCEFSQKYQAGYGQKKWYSFGADLSRTNPVTFATVLKWAKEEKQRDMSEESNRGFSIVHAAEILSKLGPVNWQIDNYLERDTTGIIFGDPGSYKTFIALDMALHCAAGMEWHGNETHQGPVVYVAGEGQGGLARRLSAWQTAHDKSIADLPVYFSQQAASLYDKESAETVTRVIDEIIKDEPPVMIIIDTLARNFGGGDENSTADMNIFIKHVDTYLREKYGCCVLVVHHTGHSNKERARGAMSLKGALDFEFRLEKPKDTEGMLVRMTCTKMKDGPEPEPAYFEGRSIDIPLDNHDPITSLVFDKSDVVMDGPTVNLKGKQLSAYECLKRFVYDSDEKIHKTYFNKELQDTEICDTASQARSVVSNLIKKGYFVENDGFLSIDEFI